jgi:hypothetical protein
MSILKLNLTLIIRYILIIVFLHLCLQNILNTQSDTWFMGAQAEESSAKSIQRVVVLALDNDSPEQVSHSYVNFLSNTIRELCSFLPPDQFGVMTQENMQVLLGSDQNLEDCEGECAVETARLLQAHWIISGRVIQVEKNWKLQINLHNSISGKFMSAGHDTSHSLNSLDQVAQKITLKLLYVIYPKLKNILEERSGSLDRAIHLDCLLDEQVCKNKKYEIKAAEALAKQAALMKASLAKVKAEQAALQKQQDARKRKRQLREKEEREKEERLERQQQKEERALARKIKREEALERQRQRTERALARKIANEEKLHMMREKRQKNRSSNSKNWHGFLGSISSFISAQNPDFKGVNKISLGYHIHPNHLLKLNVFDQNILGITRTHTVITSLGYMYKLWWHALYTGVGIGLGRFMWKYKAYKDMQDKDADYLDFALGLKISKFNLEGGSIYLFEQGSWFTYLGLGFFYY